MATRKKPAQVVALIAGAFSLLGNGLRVEEIAACAGLTEEQVRRAFTGRIDFIDRGARGWFYTSTRPLTEIM